MTRNRPDFFIVGAPKAGTTSLYGYLSQHPHVFAPEIKEPHFFSCPEVLDTYYKISFVEDEQQYRQLYATVSDDQLAGDFSPSYLFSEYAAERIHQTHPDAKIIMILRNPVERAISHYLMDVRFGLQQLSFAECLVLDKKTRLFHREYVEVGQYVRQVRRFTERFAAENVLILLHEDLIRSTVGTVGTILKFLGLSALCCDYVSRRNVHKMVRFSSMRKIIRAKGVRSFGKLLPRSVKSKVVDWMSTSEKPEFQSETIKLADIFRKENGQLSQLIDRNLDHWDKIGDD